MVNFYLRIMHTAIHDAVQPGVLSRAVRQGAEHHAQYSSYICESSLSSQWPESGPQNSCQPWPCVHCTAAVAQAENQNTSAYRSIDSNWTVFVVVLEYRISVTLLPCVRLLTVT